MTALTVRIGERDLPVKRATLRFLKSSYMPWQKKLAALDRADTIAHLDAVVEGVLLYVGHNEGVTVDWLLDTLPASIEKLRETLDACAKAAFAPSVEVAP